MAGQGSLTKLTITGAAGAITVPFNPKEYTVEQSNLYAEIAIPGLEAPIVQFVRGNSDKLTFDLLIDGTGSPPVSAQAVADSIQKLARIDPGRKAPPICTFAWGGAIMTGVIESVRRQFVLFDPSGAPLRIQMSLSVKRYVPLQDQLGAQNQVPPTPPWSPDNAASPSEPEPTPSSDQEPRERPRHPADMFI